MVVIETSEASLRFCTARLEKDDYYWITGRGDYVLNISGHLLGTAEIEASLVSHHLVSAAAVVGYPNSLL